jgi:hypothetical protein
LFSVQTFSLGDSEMKINNATTVIAIDNSVISDREAEIAEALRDCDNETVKRGKAGMYADLITHKKQHAASRLSRTAFHGRLHRSFAIPTGRNASWFGGSTSGGQQKKKAARSLKQDKEGLLLLAEGPLALQQDEGLLDAATLTS